MRVAWKLLVWVLGIYAVLVVGGGLAIKALLTPGRIGAVVRSATAGLPVEVAVQEGSFDLVPWIRFQPVLRLRKITVGNPPGFSAEPMLAVEEAGAQVSLFSLLGQQVRVRSVELRQAALNVETNARGDSNLAALVTAPDKAEPQRSGKDEGNPSGKRVSVDRIVLTGGSVRYRRHGQAGDLTLRGIHLTVSDFGTARPARLELEAQILGGSRSRLVFQGQAGPLAPNSLPAKGDLSVTLAPAEMPEEVRRQYLGDLLREPPQAAAVSLRASVQGDLITAVEGTGKVAFSDFALGRSEDTRLPLSGEAPFRITIRQALSNPAVELLSPSASLRLGEGTWKGALSVRYGEAGVSGSNSGSIRGVRIEQMLRVFTATKEPVSGVAEIPDYRLEFAGRDAAQLRNSLRGGGTLRVEQGRVGLFDLLGAIEGRIRNVLGADEGKAGTTDFLTLSGRFEIRNAQLVFPELALQNASSTITGQGSVSFDHAISFDLMTDMTGELASRLAGKRDAAGVAHLRVPVRVRGTLESPKVYPDVGGMAKGAAVEKARSLLDSFLKKRQSGAEEPKP